MFRRSRFSIRPNVGTAGRAAAAPQEAPSTTQEASETPKDVSESSTPTAVTETKTAETPSEKPPASGDGNEQNGEGTSSSAAVQRRKRFSVKPKVAPGRPSAVARTPKSPVKAVSETPVEAPGSDLEKTTTSSQTGTAAAPQGLQSPKRRRASGESKQPRVQPPTSPISSDSPALCADLVDEDLAEPTNLPTDSGKQLENKAGKHAKDVPPRPPDKVPPSLPDKESVELSEKAKTLVSSKSALSMSPSAFSLSRLLNDPSDLQRLAKAQKLRELLRQERDKERRLKQAKAPPREFTLDPTKMTMRDLIRYLPQSNPMSSSLDQSVQDETVVPPSPEREESPETAQEPEAEVLPKVMSPREEEEGVAAAAAAEEEEEEEEEDEEEESLMVPQVKVAEDGTLIIDEASLTVEVQRANKPNPAQDRDPIFERGSTTTYSSFRKGTHSKPWSSEETDMFFLAISMVGTDFSMICQLFPHRARSEIKNKFKKEERGNSWRIDKAFRERRKLDIEYFSKLLEKVLEVQKNRKKLKKLSEKNSPKKSKRKPKAKKKLSDVEEEDDDDEHESPDLEGEKENEDLCNEGASPVSKPKRQRKRKTKKAAVEEEEPKEKKMKSDKQSSEQGEVCMPEDAEAALPEDHTSSDITEKTENVKTSKDTAIKPAKLSRGRAPKPLLPLGRKWGKKAAPASTQAKGAAADEEDEGASVEVSKEQESTESSPSNKANKKKSADDSDNSSEEEDASIQPPKPTRYGRVPKRTNLLKYPGKEGAHSSATDSTPNPPAGSTAPAAKPKPRCSAKRGRSSEQKSANKSKKPKLVTLRASQLESSDEEDGKQWDNEEIEEQPACSSSKDSTAPVFVPVCVRSPQPMLSEVEETMEELDILANMPDVLGISQDSLCPDASCDRVQNDTGTPEPCEHQLDLLVDVIDFLSSEHTGVAEDESYNEAAQTLLTIGNLTHLSQSAQSQTATQDHTTGTQHPEEGPAPKPAEQEENTDALVSGDDIKETPATDATVELQSSTTDSGDISTIKTSDENTQKSSPPTRRGRLPTVKPKPNLGRASRSAKTKSSPVRTVEETNTETHNLDVTESPSTLEETSSKILEYSPSLLMDDAVSQEKSGATTSDQSHSFSDSQSESSDGKVMSATETNASYSNNSAKSNTSTAEEVSHHDEVASTCQSRRSRLQKVKPKPNIPQTSRTARSTPKTTEAGTCGTSPQKTSQNVGAAPTREQSTTEENRTDVGLAGQVCPVAATSDQSPSENKSFSKDLFEQSSRDIGSMLESTDATGTTHGKASESCSNLVTFDSPVAESQVGQDVAPVQESSVTPGEDLPDTQKAESEVASTCQSRRSRLQKVKPKPNLPRTSRTARSAPQTTKDSSPSPTSKVLETPKVEVETEATSSAAAGTSDQSTSENQSISQDLFEQSSRDAVSAGTTLVTSASAVTVSQVGQDTAPVQESSDQPATPVENLPDTQKVETEVISTGPARTVRSQKVKPKPNLAPTTRTARSKAQTTKDPVEQLVEGHPSPTSKSGSTGNTLAEAEAQPVGSVVLPESTGTASGPGPSCTSHKPAGESASTPAVPQRRRHSLKFKPNLASPLRATQTKVQPKNISKPSDEQHVDTSVHEVSEQASADSSQTELKLAGCLTCPSNTEVSSTKSVTAEPEKTVDGTDVGTSSDGVVVATSMVAANKNSEKSTFGRDSLGDKMSHKDLLEAGPSSQGNWEVDISPSITIESNTQPLDVPDVHSSKDSSAGSEVSPVLSTDASSIPDPEESSLQPCSQSDSSQDAAEQRSETREMTQTSNDKSQSSTHEAELPNSPNSSKKAPPTRRGRLIKPKPNLGRGSRPPPPHQVQSTAQAEADADGRSEDVDASLSHSPAPELQCDVQEPAEGAVEPHSSQEASANDSGSLLGCLTEIIEQLSQSESPTNDAGSSVGSVTQGQDSSSQNTSALSLEGSQQSLTLFPDMLSEQVTSEPDEPFFILSLTEIPVCSSGQEVDSAAEPLPYLPLADASIQQHSSVPGESSATVGEEGSLSTVPVSDITAYIDSITEDPVDPHESTTTVQPPTSPENVEKTEETEIASEQRPTGAGRRGKLQVKPSTTRKKQPSKSRATKTNQDTELSGVSVQPEASDDTAKGEDDVVTELQKGSGDHVNIEKESPAGGKDLEDPTSGAQTRTRKTKASSAGESSGLSTEPSPGKAASRDSKVKTPRTTRKRSSAPPTPVASTSHNATSTHSRTQLPDDGPTTAPTASSALTEVDVELTTEHHHQLFSESTSSSSQCTSTEVSLCQQSECVEEEVEEPTSVSQYFLSDIFTEVEEG